MLPSIFGGGLFDDWFDFPFERSLRGYDPAFRKSALDHMRTDIRDTGDSYELSTDLPGYSKENISVQLHDGFLTVVAKRNSDSEEKDKDGRYLRRERCSGQCSRSFYVGENITEDDISAKMDNGILTLIVPKRDTKKLPEKKYIAIE